MVCISSSNGPARLRGTTRCTHPPGTPGVAPRPVDAALGVCVRWRAMLRVKRCKACGEVVLRRVETPGDAPLMDVEARALEAHASACWPPPEGEHLADAELPPLWTSNGTD